MPTCSSWPLHRSEHNPGDLSTPHRNPPSMTSGLTSLTRGLTCLSPQVTLDQTPSQYLYYICALKHGRRSRGDSGFSNGKGGKPPTQLPGLFVEHTLNSPTDFPQTEIGSQTLFENCMRGHHNEGCLYFDLFPNIFPLLVSCLEFIGFHFILVAFPRVYQCMLRRGM